MKFGKNIKFILLILFITVLFLGNASAYAAITPTDTPTTPSKVTPTSVLTPAESPSDSQEQSQIEKIKEMVAQKVAKLNLVEKKGILGTVKEATTTEITFQDKNNQEQIAEIDELTAFTDSGTNSKTFGISDVKPGDLLSCIGLYNKETKHILARYITRIHSLPVEFEGVVTDEDTKNFTVTAVNDQGVKRVINIDFSTKIQVYSKDAGMVKSGFSKIQTGQRIFAQGFNDTNDKNVLNASDVIYFTDLPPSDAMKKFASINLGATPSSGSGKIVTPITK